MVVRGLSSKILQVTWSLYDEATVGVTIGSESMKYGRVESGGNG